MKQAVGAGEKLLASAVPGAYLKGMLAKIYSNALLEAAGNIPKAERLENPDATARKVSRVCGSEVTVDLNVEDGVITEFAVEAKACALGQASSSLLAKHIVGATTAEMRQVRDAVYAMLKEDGPVPAGERWQELEKLQPIKEYPARHASTLLVFEATIACLDQIEELQRAAV
jgi:NifU-like protein involved in Fe-S cluster formation